MQDSLDPQSWNRYAYVRNNPLKYVDPSGNIIVITLDYPGKEPSVAEQASGLDWSGAPSFGSTSDIPEGTYGEAFVGGVAAFVDFPGGRESAGNGGGAANNSADGGGYSDRDGGSELSQSSKPDAGGLVGAAVSESGGHVSPVGLALSTAELSLQGASYNIFNRSLQTVERALKNEEFVHINGRTYSQTFRGNKYISSASVDMSRTVGQTLRGVGRVVLGLSIIATGYQFAMSNYSGADWARLAGAAVIMSSSLIPVVGPFVSIGFGFADAFGVLDPIYNYFDR